LPKLLSDIKGNTFWDTVYIIMYYSWTAA